MRWRARTGRSTRAGSRPSSTILRRQGIELFPQDGSGITSADQIVVASAAVEDHVPDMVKARALGAARLGRPELLAELFNAADDRHRGRAGPAANRRSPA